MSKTEQKACLSTFRPPSPPQSPPPSSPPSPSSPSFPPSQSFSPSPIRKRRRRHSFSGPPLVTAPRNLFEYDDQPERDTWKTLPTPTSPSFAIRSLSDPGPQLPNSSHPSHAPPRQAQPPRPAATTAAKAMAQAETRRRRMPDLTLVFAYVLFSLELAWLIMFVLRDVNSRH
jgi:hypothetical protein